MSHITLHVHMLILLSCGEGTGPTKKARSLFFIRDEKIGGSKDSNDALSTLFEALNGRDPDAPPPSYRYGQMRASRGSVKCARRADLLQQPVISY